MATVEFALLGVSEFAAALAGMTARVDQATRTVVAEGALLIQRQAQLNASGRPGPRVRSGTLRRSIRVDGPRRAEGGWEARIGPTVIYARRVELGFHGTDRIGRTYHQPPYPYFRPAFTYGTTVAIHARWRDAITASMGV